MTQPQFDLDWPYGYQTRDERYVVIYCTDAPGNSPIHGRINGASAAIAWNIHGRFRVDRLSELDLINRPAPIVNVPVDKLHGGIACVNINNYFCIASSYRITKQDHNRPIKWFYVDEAETTK